MGENIKISIVLPTYNGGKYIKKAIESVISQSFSGWELLVIDDGSTDNTKDIVNEYVVKDERIKYLKNEQNLGIQKTLNRGLKEAKGEYIARIDDDDYWVDKDKLSKQFDVLNNNKSYVLVGTGVVVVDENEKELFRYLLPKGDKEIRNKILSKNCFVHSSVMFNKDVALSFGGYSEEKDVKHIEDYDLWLKIGTKGKFCNISEYSVNYTLRGGSISSVNKREQFRKNLRLIKGYKDKYKNYIVSFLVRSLAYFMLNIFIILPKKIQKLIIKKYKSA